MLTPNPQSVFLNLLKDRLDLTHIPFSDRMARMMMFRNGGSFYIRLAERWEKQQNQLGNYRQRHPIVDAFRLIGPDGTPLPFKLTTYPHQLILDTPLGIVQCAFTDRRGGTFHLASNSPTMYCEISRAWNRS